MSHQVAPASPISTASGTSPMSGRKLTKDAIAALTQRFFVFGTMHRTEYGAAPILKFNYAPARTTIVAAPWFEVDLQLLERTIDARIFHQGPKLWMIGEIEPLKALQDPLTRSAIIERIITEYPVATLEPGEVFYRLRKSPAEPANVCEYDSPPDGVGGFGRLDSKSLAVMYASQDIEICLHECRVTVEDEIYISTLNPTKHLRLLNLTPILKEDDNISEFESLDLAVSVLFLAGGYSYEITRQLAVAACSSGFDGINYPSYFSLLRTGGIPFETLYGISLRRLAALHGRFGLDGDLTSYLSDHETKKIIPNLALFGRPIKQGLVEVRCINRMVLKRVAYDAHFGPVGYS
jgi:RES domain-containing protein